MGCTICTVKDILCPQTLELRMEKLAMMRKKLLMGKKSDDSEHTAVSTTEDHQVSVQMVEIWMQP